MALRLVHGQRALVLGARDEVGIGHDGVGLGLGVAAGLIQQSGVPVAVGRPPRFVLKRPDDVVAHALLLPASGVLCSPDTAHVHNANLIQRFVWVGVVAGITS